MTGGGWLRLVLTRVRADAAVIGVAWLVILATVALLAASASYAEAVGRSGLTARLARADFVEVNVQVRAGLPPAQVADAEQAVTRELGAALAPAGGTIHRFGRSESFALPDRPADAPELTVFAFAERLEENASLVAGEWPAAGGDPVESVVSEAAAQQLGLAVGDQLEVVSRLDAGQRVAVRIVGVFEPLEPGAAYWWADRLDLEGVVARSSFTTYGPLFVPRDDLLSRTLAGRATLYWRAEPSIEAIDALSVGPIGRRVATLEERIAAALPDASIGVETGLPGLLAGAASSLQVSRSGILLLDLQLGLLGLYALVMLSALIVEQRRIDTALLRSRGASGSQLAGLGLAEAVILVVPAVIVGPWLALVLLSAFGAIGPLADIGVAIHPRLTGEALVLAGAAGLISIGGLVLPQVAASGPLAGVRRMLGRQLQRTAAHRLGVDVAVIVVAGIGLWQLNQQGTPLTRTLRGSLGIDPLLVAAPMIGLLAGALLSLRLLPLLANGLERVLSRRRGPALGARQLARRPLRYSRAALLLIVAAAVTVFAAAYGATATRSVHDQVAYAAGADARVTLPGSGARDVAELSTAVAMIDGVTAATLVLRDGYRLGATGSRGTLVALDARHAEHVVTFRPDLGSAPLGQLMDQLRPGGGLPGVELPPTVRRLAVDLRAELLGVGQDHTTEPLPGTWQGLSAAVVIVDASGLMQRLVGEAVLGPQGGRIVFDVPAATPFPGTEPGYSLAAVEPALRAPVTGAMAGELAVAGLAVSHADEGEEWQPLSVVAVDWQSARIEPDGTAVVLEAAELVDAGARILAELPLPAAGRATYSLRAPGVRESVLLPLPALVNRAFLEQSGAELGDPIAIAERFATPRTVAAVAVVEGFPTLAPADPLAVVDLAALAVADYAELARLPEPGELWLAAPASDAPLLRRDLTAEPLSGQQPIIAADELARRLTDPLSVGTAGALVLGTLAAVLFAAVGFLVNAAVGARERMIEFGLLQALGVSRRQLASALTLEGAFLLGASLVLGIGLGVALAVIALPTATLTEQGGSPVPVATPVWPLEPLLGLVVLAFGLLAVTGLLYRRWLDAGELGSLLRLREE